MKYERIKVITTTDTASSVDAGMVIPRFTSHPTNLSEKLSAAKALPRNPDSVIATCMVAKNFAG